MFAISELRLAVVGVGALGSELCEQLATAGVRRALVIDPDVLESRNTATSPLYAALLDSRGPTVIGQPKASLIVNFLRDRFVDLAWEARCEEIADIGLGELMNYDAILSCPDSTLARVETTRASQSLRLPMLDGGLFPDNHVAGRVSFFPADGESACYLCGLSGFRRAEVLANALSPSLSCAATSDSISMAGSGLSARLVAGKMVDYVRLLASGNNSAQMLDQGGYTDRLRFENSSEISKAQESSFWERHRLVRGVDCPWHEFELPDRLIAVRESQTFTESLTAYSQNGDDVRVDLPWPICLVSHCVTCGFEDRPRKRVAAVRRGGLCPRCGVRGKMEPMETLATIKRGDCASAYTPKQLGLPDRQLYTLRRGVVFRRSGDAE